MIKNTLLFVILLLSIPIWSQVEDVILIEEKEPKRWMLYAQNNTNEEQEAFLMVQGEGFRRSANRPVIKKVPPQTKVLMITLIPLKDTQPSYTTIFTYENELQTLKKKHSDSFEEHVNIRPLQDDELTVFTIYDCPKCELLLSYLNKHRIPHRVLDVDKHDKVREFMFSHLRDSVSKPAIVKLPVIMFKKKKYFDIEHMERFLERKPWK